MSASEQPIVMTRIAVAFERIASALESKATAQQSEKVQPVPSTSEVLQELLLHCERQSSAAAKRAKYSRGYSPAVDGNNRSSAKWKRFAVAIRAVLDANSSS